MYEKDKEREEYGCINCLTQRSGLKEGRGIKKGGGKRKMREVYNRNYGWR
jgi:hypothetical protein